MQLEVTFFSDSIMVIHVQKKKNKKEKTRP